MEMMFCKVFINLAVGMSITSSHGVWYCLVLNKCVTNCFCPKRAGSAKLYLLWTHLLQHTDIKGLQSIQCGVLNRWNLGKLVGTNTGRFEKDCVYNSPL